MKSQLSTLNVQLDARQSPQNPLYRQLYEQVRAQILHGQLTPGQRLPATRRLAEMLAVSRETVNTAVNQLQAEGFVTVRPGAGVFVTQHLPRTETSTAKSPKATAVPHLSRWGTRMTNQRLAATAQTSRTTHTTERAEFDFGFGRAFAENFPYDVWRRLLGRYLSSDDALLARYGSVAGFMPLREAVADYLTRLRGVRTTAGQVVIVSGIQQALDILARLLINPGDEILVETPGYVNAFKLFQAYGSQLVPLAVDYHGFDPARIPVDSKARLVFVTPSNQFPHGGAMPVGRRLALLQWAQKQEAFIIEDDYDGELRYDSHPLAALQGLDNDGRVVYLGTFSKVLFPALRLGYVVLPPTLIRPFLQAKQLMDRGAPTLTQAAIADFIGEGHFERHLRRLRETYGRRRQLLLDTLGAELGELVQYDRNLAGGHLLVYLPSGLAERTVIQAAAAYSVAVYAGSPYHLHADPRPSILLGFSGLTDTAVVEGIRRLAQVIKKRTSPHA